MMPKTGEAGKVVSNDGHSGGEMARWLVIVPKLVGEG